MASIQNTGHWPITLPSGTVIPGRTTMVCENKELRNSDNTPRLSALVAVGEVIVEYDPEPVEEAPAQAAPAEPQAPAEPLTLAEPEAPAEPATPTESATTSAPVSTKRG
jgi:hypothetical protein